MARVNLEDRFFSDPRLRQLSVATGFSVMECIGKMASLWHQSQSRLQRQVSRLEIELWTETKPEDACKFIDALCSLNFLKKRKNENFLVKGNTKQIENLKKYRNRASSAAKKRWKQPISLPKSDDTTGDATSMPNDATSMPNDATSTLNSIQNNTKQCNTIHNLSTNNRSCTNDSSSDTLPKKPACKKRVTAIKSDMEWIESLKLNPAYSFIDIDRELARMDAWLSTRPQRQKTRRFIVNWLNKIDKPIGGNNDRKNSVVKEWEKDKCRDILEGNADF